MKNNYVIKKHNKFQIIITAFNPKPDFLKKCLKSLANQTYKHFSVCVLDDFSNDKHKQTYRNIIKKYCDLYKWQYIFKNENKGPLLSRIECIEKLNPDDEDIVVSIDGDDYLYSINSLEILNNYYQDNTLITFGNFISKKANTKKIKPIYNCYKLAPIFQKMYENNLFRKKWLFSHLKTFKYKLYKKIDHNDLKDKENNYFKSATDLALMYPMIEMSNGRFKCVNEILYVYNHFHSESNHNNSTKKQKQKSNANIIRKKKTYSPVF